MKLSQVEWGTVGKAAFKEYRDDDVPGLAAEMAYWIIFSIFPFFIFLATVAGLIGRALGVDNILDNITDNLYSALDPNTAGTLRGVLGTILTPGGGALSFGALVSAVLALNSASTAIATMMKAFNRAYGVEETRNFFVAKLYALGLTLVLVLLLIGGSLLLTAGGKLADVFNLGTAGTILLTAGRLVGALVGISLALAILYWKGPNIKQSFTWISPGSILATLAMALFSALFGLYVSFFAGASFNKTYGAIAGAIIFLFFLRIVSTCILLGAEFNAETTRRYDPETIRDEMADPRKQLPGEQPVPHPQAAAEAGVTLEQVAATNAPGAPGGAPRSPRAGGAIAGADDVEPRLEARLRQLRGRPFVSAVAQVREQQARRTPVERDARARVAVAAFGVSAATALSGVLVAAARRFVR